jgi:hypothetical protein
MPLKYHCRVRPYGASRGYERRTRVIARTVARTAAQVARDITVRKLSRDEAAQRWLDANQPTLAKWLRRADRGFGWPAGEVTDSTPGGSAHPLCMAATGAARLDGIAVTLIDRTHAVRSDTHIDPARRILLRLNGAFLTIVGGTQVVFELLSHYADAGPYAGVFTDSPYTIGWVENHGLALLIGILVLAVATRDGRRSWHAFLLAVHLLLGTANLLFWDSLLAFDKVWMGAGATVVHAGFALAHLVAMRRSRTV